MTQENLLQRGAIHSLSTWQQREELQWCQSIRRFLLVVMLISCSYRLLDQCLFNSESQALGIVVAATSTLVCSIYLLARRNQNPGTEKLKMIVMLSIIQLYILSLAVFIYPESKELWAMKSTLVFCVYELPSFHERWLIIVLLGRQFLMWQLPSLLAGNGVHSVTFYCIMLAVAVIILVISASELSSRATEHYSFCESIDEQETKINNLLQAIPEGLAVVTEEQGMPSANSRMQDILGSADGLTAKLGTLHCLEHVEAEETLPLSLLEQIRLFLKFASTDIETFGVTKIKDDFFEWKGTKCYWGKSVACILTASNISLWATSQRNLLHESNSKTAMLRFVSHELRTPANAILNLASSVMTADNVLPEQKRELSIVVTSTHFLLSVVNDLLDFTRIVADKFNLVKQSFNVRKEIQDSVNLVQLQCAHKGLFIKLKFDDLIPEVIYSDSTRIKQVILNLLGNALKFTFHGGIRVICMLTNSNSLRIIVKDTGLGIPEDKISGLCQAFKTVEGTQHINPQGCGLGLYISNLLALSLGAKPIDIKSKVGIGSEFSFQVRIYQHQVEGEEGVLDTTIVMDEERESEEEIRYPVLRGGHMPVEVTIPAVLIVDDCDFNRVVLLKMLETLHVRADEAASGLRAVALIRAAAKRGSFYRLILMDLEMPEMDGLTATQEIRTMEITGELTMRPRIVACSAHRGREEADRLLAAGMDSYMEKPVSKSKLRDLVLGV